jgi:serine/threonine protein kinase
MYSPPEQLDDTLYFKYTLPTMDIYSYGVLLYNVIFQGADPFGGGSAYNSNPTGYLKNKKKFEYRTDTTLPQGFDNAWNTILHGCLKPSPKERFQSMQEIIDILPIIDNSNIENGPYFHSINPVCIGNIKIIHNESVQIINLNEFLMKGITMITIGRAGSERNQNIINLHPTNPNDFVVSKAHAVIELNNDNLYLMDGQENHMNGKKMYRPSLNGTMVNGKKVQQGQKILLKFGDKINIGPYVLEYINVM